MARYPPLLPASMLMQDQEDQQTSSSKNGYLHTLKHLSAQKLKTHTHTQTQNQGTTEQKPVTTGEAEHSFKGQLEAD